MTIWDPVQNAWQCSLCFDPPEEPEELADYVEVRDAINRAIETLKSGHYATRVTLALEILEPIAKRLP